MCSYKLYANNESVIASEYLIKQHRSTKNYAMQLSEAFCLENNLKKDIVCDFILLYQDRSKTPFVGSRVEKKCLTFFNTL